LVKLGILPRVLEERLGTSAYNLAVLGGQAPGSYYLLRRVLENGRRPRAVVVNFSALLLAMDPRANVSWWATMADGRDRLELVWRTLDPALAATMTVQGLISSWSCRDIARTALGLEGRHPREGGTAPDDLRVFERNWRLNRGAQVAPRLFVPIEGALLQPYDGRQWKWRPHPAHVFYVERFLILAQSHRIPVYWVLTPASQAWRDRNERAGTIPAYRQFVRGFLCRFPVLTILDGQHLVWDHRDFRDPIHLNRDGALRLSLAVAESIASHPTGSVNETRWIDLAGIGRPPPRQLQDLLEDLDQSRLAVNRQGAAERAPEGSN
jgi:hypothetical protein